MPDHTLCKFWQFKWNLCVIFANSTNWNRVSSHFM